MMGVVEDGVVDGGAADDWFSDNGSCRQLVLGTMGIGDDGYWGQWASGRMDIGGNGHRGQGRR